MKKFFTMDMNFVILKSFYLQSLISHLPDHKLKGILVAPRKEILDNLKNKLRSLNEQKSRPYE
jgi:hypothetical protein